MAIIYKILRLNFFRMQTKLSGLGWMITNIQEWHCSYHKNSAKWHFAKLTTTNSVDTMLLSKPTSASHPPITGQEFTPIYSATPKPVFAANKENNPQTNRHHCIHFQHPTSPTSASMQTSLGPCLLPDGNTNTFCA
jgi:hypothetical protein